MLRVGSKEFFSFFLREVDNRVAEDGGFLGVDIVEERTFRNVGRVDDVLDGDVVIAFVEDKPSGVIFDSAQGF